MRSKLFRIRLGMIVIFSVFISSCVMFSPTPRTADELFLPARYTLYDAEAPVPDRWWEDFGSSELTGLVEQALAGSFTIQQAWARLRQAEALAIQQGVAFQPSLSVEGSASRSAIRSDLSSGSAATVYSESYGLGLAGSYELDLWGRVRSVRRSAWRTLEASRDDVHTAMLSVAAEVTSTWLELVAGRQQLSLLVQQLATNRTSLELVELRYRNGLAGVLDVYQQRRLVVATEASIPPLRALLKTLEHQLAILIGRPPVSDLSLQAGDLPELSPMPQQGLPADLLARRPDIRAAGLRLQAADWQLSAARADRLPAIRLSASASYSSGDRSRIFDNWIATLAGSLTGPVFDGGRRRAEVVRIQAVVDEKLASYRAAVYGAVREVEDALVRGWNQAEYLRLLREQLEIARHEYTEARERYRRGLDSYLATLTALSTAQQLERTIVQAHAQQLSYRLQLLRALGGTWMQEQSMIATIGREE